MDECIMHMRQDAFLPVEGVGLAPHVPGLQGAPLPEKGMTAFTWVLPQSMVCPVSIACKREKAEIELTHLMDIVTLEVTLEICVSTGPTA